MFLIIFAAHFVVVENNKIKKYIQILAQLGEKYDKMKRNILLNLINAVSHKDCLQLTLFKIIVLNNIVIE